MESLSFNKPRLAVEVVLIAGAGIAAGNLTNAIQSNADEVGSLQRKVLIPHEAATHPNQQVEWVTVDTDPTDDPGFFQLPQAVQEAKKRVAELNASDNNMTPWTVGGILVLCAGLGSGILHARKVWPQADDPDVSAA